MPLLSTIPIRDLRLGLENSKYFQFEFYQALYELHFLGIDSYKVFKADGWPNSAEIGNLFDEDFEVFSKGSHDERKELIGEHIEKVLISSKDVHPVNSNIGHPLALDAKNKILKAWSSDPVPTVSLKDLFEEDWSDIQRRFVPAFLFASFVLEPPELVSELKPYRTPTDFPFSQKTGEWRCYQIIEKNPGLSAEEIVDFHNKAYPAPNGDSLGRSSVDAWLSKLKKAVLIEAKSSPQDKGKPVLKYFCVNKY